MATSSTMDTLFDTYRGGMFQALDEGRITDILAMFQTVAPVVGKEIWATTGLALEPDKVVTSSGTVFDFAKS